MASGADTLAVLIVEDEALLAMDIEAMVVDCGHRVVAEAASLDDVAALRIEPPDLVFLDMHLARGSSGLDVAALVRDRWDDAVIVFVTANPKKIPADFAGAHGVIPKPFSRNGLMSAMRYLQQGMTAPPPSIPRPISFVPAPTIADRWS
ncbi:response regulator [Sphingomonas sp. Tas61C01]|uniref:response regulator n=1 Tax=Sphingomonas sp. Tas61C01 TaxID=3458297 RepID=UPI00403EF142